MADDDELLDFSNVCRLFPLPEVVLFPHVVLPLHIFEPRYRQMTEDALADDKLVTIVQSRVVGSGLDEAEPELEEVACLGEIIEHERLINGRFNFLLLGRKRVRLTREIPSGKLYRLAEGEVLEDQCDDDLEGPRRSELITLFRRVFPTYHEMDSDLGALLDSEVPLGVLTDVLAHALGLPAEIKQILLAETWIDRRAAQLREILSEVVGRDPDFRPGPKLWPPSFSTN